MSNNGSNKRLKYIFEEPHDDVTWSSQLQECANRCRFVFKWDWKVEQPNGADMHVLTPLINQRPYPQFAAASTKKQDAKNKAAELLVQSGVLNPWLEQNGN